jgi:hypothetical protein
MKMAISIILLLISFLIYIVCVFEIDITSFIKNKIRRKKVKREINQAIQELEEAQQAFNKFKERKYIMTKIEKKLIELGYEEYWIPTLYIKTVDDWEYIIDTKNFESSYVISKTETDIILKSQDDIDFFQKILNKLQQDLEVLRKYESREINISN